MRSTRCRRWRVQGKTNIDWVTGSSGGGAHGRSVVDECEVLAFDAFFEALYSYYAQPNEWHYSLKFLPQLTACVREVFVSEVVHPDSRLAPILSHLGHPQDSRVLHRSGVAKPDPAIFG